MSVKTNKNVVYPSKIWQPFRWPIYFSLYPYMPFRWRVDDSLYDKYSKM